MTDHPIEDSIEAPAREALASSLRGMDQTMELATPMMKSMMLAQMHMTGFATKRTRAMLALPRQVAECRSPQDFWALNMTFWQTAATQYVEASRGAMGAIVPMASATVAAPLQAVPTAPSTGRTSSAASCMSERDVIAFPTDRARAPGSAPDVPPKS